MAGVAGVAGGGGTSALTAYADAAWQLIRAREALDAAVRAGDDERAAIIAADLPALEAARNAAKAAAEGQAARGQARRPWEHRTRAP